MALTSLNLTAPPVQPKPEVRANPLENPAVPLSAGAAWLMDSLGGESVAAGVRISDSSALESITAVYACVNVISSDISSLPLKTYEVTETGKKPALDTDIGYLLLKEPNPEQSAPDFICTIVASAVLTGSGYAEIQRDNSGKVVALWPRHPSTTRPVRLANGVLAFECRDTGTPRIIASTDMLHLKGLTLDGYGSGLSPISAARQTLGLAKAAELTSASLFGNGSRPSGILQVPQDMDEQARISAKASWEKAQSGSNQGRTAVLPSGFTWTPLAINPSDSQFIETMKFSISQIAGIFRVPPHMIGDTTRLSNSNHESQALEYLTSALRPWMVRLEAEIERKLMPRIGRNAGRYTVAFDFSEMIRGDYATVMAGLAVSRQWGFASINDARSVLGQNPIGPAGDVYMVPMNMASADSLLHPPIDPQPAAPKIIPTPLIPSTENDASRTLIQRVAGNYLPLFRDGLGRILSREKRDLESITRCLTPTLQIVADEATRQALGTFRLSSEDAIPTDKIVRDAVKTVEKRIADESAEDLTNRLCRAIVIGVFKEAATAVVAPKDLAA